MKKHLLLLLVVLFVVLLAVPTLAVGDAYDFNGVALPTKTTFGASIFDMWLSQGALPAYLFAFSDSSGESYSFYILDHDGIYDSQNGWFQLAVDTKVSVLVLDENNLWYVQSVNEYPAGTPLPLGTVFWSAFDLYDTEGNICLDKDPFCYSLLSCDSSSCPSIDQDYDSICDVCGYKFSVPRAFTVRQFVYHIGQLFTSSMSWVGNVGSTILQQPLLLAFTTLPLCGLGVAVFRRLKETV